MGQPRAGKRVVVVSSAEDNDTGEDQVIENAEHGAARDLKRPVRVEKGRAREQRTNSKSATPEVIAPAQKKPNKNSAKAEAKKGKGTIFSFFNAATEKQQASQPSNSQPKPKESVKTEPIDDAIDEDDLELPFAKGSQTVLAQRKRKLRQDHNHLDIAEGLDAPSATQKFLKASSGQKIPARVANTDQRPWTEQYAPVDLSELAVHKRKVTDVRALLEEAVSARARPRLIVLKGSAGTGKTATVNLLAKDLGLVVMEWKNSAGADFSNDAFVSASVQFEDFLLRGGRFTGLDLFTDNSSGGPAYQATSGKPLDGDRAQILLIEEFPNTFSRSSTALQSFRSTIQQYLAVPATRGQRIAPIVMIISETLLSTSTAAADSFTAHRLLGPSILTHPLTAEIEFNGVAPTILTKALEAIVVKEARKSGRRMTPGPQVLKRLAETGDIRSAISSLEFLCLRGDDGDSWSAKVAFTKSKRANKEAPLTKQEQDALKLIGNRESTLGIFHAVGKVVYNKRFPASNDIPQPPSHLPQHRKVQAPETDAEALLVELGTDTSTFVAALHENYVLSCSSSSTEEFIDSFNGCIDSLSDADLLAPDRFSSGGRNFSGSAQDNLRQDDMSFQTAVRGILFNLPYPITRATPASGRKGDSHRIFYPASLKIWKRKEEIEGLLDLVLTSLQGGIEVDKRTSIVKPTGVEAWTRNAFAQSDTTKDQEDFTEDASMSTIVMSSLARTEMLLERLPYMSRILDHNSSVSTALRERVATLTSIEGVAPVGEEDADADDDADANGAFADWATDRPDGEDGRQHRGKRRDRGQRLNKGVGSKSEREGGGLNIPVEHEVARLVLEDDDIVDD